MSYFEANSYGVNGADDWQTAIIKQQQEAATQKDIGAQNAASARYNEWMGKLRAEQAKQAEIIQNRNTDMSTAMVAMAGNNGVLPSSLVGALGESLGIQNMAGARIDPKTGNIVAYQFDNGGNMVPFMSVGLEQQRDIVNKGLVPDAKRIFGDALYDAQQSKSGWTDSQMANHGWHRSDRPYVTGSTTISPSAASALFGRPQRRSSISAFGANGQGGFTNYESNASTGYQLVSKDSGTRDEAEKDRNAARLADVERAKAEAKAAGRTGLTYEERKELQDARQRNEREIAETKIGAAKERDEYKNAFYIMKEREKARDNMRKAKAGIGDKDSKGNDLVPGQRRYTDEEIDEHVNKNYPAPSYGDEKKDSVGTQELPKVDNTTQESIPGYSKERVDELKRRGYYWDGKKWNKKAKE